MSDTVLSPASAVDTDHHDHHQRHISDVRDGGDDASLLLTSPAEGMPDDPITIIETAIERLREDVGAIVEPAVVAAFSILRATDLPNYLRLRHKAKEVNKGCLVTELDKAVQQSLPGGGDEPSALDELVALARAQCQLKHDADRNAVAVISMPGRQEVWRVYSTGYEEWLRTAYWRAKEAGVPETTMKSADAPAARAAARWRHRSAVAAHQYSGQPSRNGADLAARQLPPRHPVPGARTGRRAGFGEVHHAGRAAQPDRSQQGDAARSAQDGGGHLRRRRQHKKSTGYYDKVRADHEQLSRQLAAAKKELIEAEALHTREREKQTRLRDAAGSMSMSTPPAAKAHWPVLCAAHEREDELKSQVSNLESQLRPLQRVLDAPQAFANARKHLAELIAQRKTSATDVETADAQIAKLNKRIADLEARIASETKSASQTLLEGEGEFIVPESLTKLEVELRIARSSLADLQSKRDTASAKLGDLPAAMREAERQRIVQLLIERVTLREEGIEITWRDTGWHALAGEMRPGTIGGELLEMEQQEVVA
jgi:hypothetical protein